MKNTIKIFILMLFLSCKNDTKTMNDFVKEGFGVKIYPVGHLVTCDLSKRVIKFDFSPNQIIKEEKLNLSKDYLDSMANYFYCLNLNQSNNIFLKGGCRVTVPNRNFVVEFYKKGNKIHEFYYNPDDYIDCAFPLKSKDTELKCFMDFLYNFFVPLITNREDYLKYINSSPPLL